MRLSKGAKILFTKRDIADMLGVGIPVLRVAAQSERVYIIDWKDRKQRFTDDQVFAVIKSLRKRLTDAEIDSIIRENAGF